MRIYLDNSPHKIAVKSHKYNYDFGQFRTPLTKYAIAEGTGWVLDNGAFSGFDRESFIRMQTVALDDDDCEWIVIPDKVGDHDETLRLFDEWMKEFDIPAHKAAFVAQNGCSHSLVPWEDIGCLFIGGTNEFKDSVGALNLAIEATNRGKWVHVGRVNSSVRLLHWFHLCDSIDGSGISKYSHMLERMIGDLDDLEKYQQTRLEEWT